jgi:hypothetical protein
VNEIPTHLTACARTVLLYGFNYFGGQRIGRERPHELRGTSTIRVHTVDLEQKSRSAVPGIAGRPPLDTEELHAISQRHWRVRNPSFSETGPDIREPGTKTPHRERPRRNPFGSRRASPRSGRPACSPHIEITRVKRILRDFVTVRYSPIRESRSREFDAVRCVQRPLYGKSEGMSPVGHEGSLLQSLEERCKMQLGARLQPSIRQ